MIAHGGRHPQGRRGAPPGTPREALPRLPQARARDGHRAAHHARHAPPEGGGAAADPMALPPLRRRRHASQDCSPRARTPPRWPNAPQPSWRRPRWWVREARRSEVERSVGTTRRTGGTVPRPSTPRQCKGESQRGTAGPATDGERAGARRASGRRAGPAGGRAGDSGDRLTEAPASSQAPAGGPAGTAPGAPGRTRCRSCPRQRRGRQLRVLPAASSRRRGSRSPRQRRSPLPRLSCRPSTLRCRPSTT